MQRILAIAWLTWKAALRFKLFLVIAVLLIGAVVGLPLVIQDDGTAQGFTQIILTYTLSVITVLLGISTLWLACGTLARDIEECQMQVVATKPVARWQIWLTAASASVWEVLLQREAGVSVGAQVSAVVVLGLTAFMLTYASDRRAELLVQTSRREKLAALGQLSAGVGHDLRNPLAAVANAIFVLRRRLEKAAALTPGVEQPLALAERELAASQRIIGDLLDYARETPWELKPVPLRALMDEPLIMSSRQVSPVYFDMLTSVCRTHGLTPRVIHEVRSVTSQVAYVGCGQGVALVPASMRKLAPENVVVRPLKEKIMVVTAAAVWNTNRHHPMVDEALEMLKK